MQAGFGFFYKAAEGRAEGLKTKKLSFSRQYEVYIVFVDMLNIVIWEEEKPQRYEGFC
jgi:hypothetical protein